MAERKTVGDYMSSGGFIGKSFRMGQLVYTITGPRRDDVVKVTCHLPIVLPL